MAMVDTNTDVMINRTEYGGSIPVDNVQALASKDPKHIPIRYIRPDIEYEEILVDESSQIPVIDISKLTVAVAGQSCYDDELAKLHVACRDWGFFQLINHGVSESIDAMKKVTEEFFKLPLDEKMKCAQIPNTIEGYGQAFVVSEEQKLDWGDMLFILPLPVALRNLRFWPQNPNSFRETLDEYSNKLYSVSKKLFKLISINLGIEPETVGKMFENCIQGIRMNYYPPCSEARKVLGLAPHSDATGLTLLVQVNEVQGLQIKKNSKWVPIKPIPGSIIVNIGDVMEIMSNGEYNSIEHRAVVDFEKERLSIAAFHSPGLEAMIGPLPELVKDKTPKYKTIDGPDYLKLVINSKLDGKGLIDHMRNQ